ncbi:hypothetical protein MIDIC_170041 [Alphaproteobacteria bacterium]
MKKILLRKHSIAETVFAVLKGRLELETYDTPFGMLYIILSSLFAYLKSSKPSISFPVLIHS